MELSGHASVIADRANRNAILAIDDPDLIVRGVRNENVLLFWRRREGEIQDRSAGAEFQATRAAAFRAAGRRRGMDEKFLHELALFRKNLNSVAAAFADVDQTVVRDVDAVQDREPLMSGGGPLVS